jgi:hypothetical protein
MTSITHHSSERQWGDCINVHFKSTAKPGTSEALQEDLGNHVILVELIIDETTVHSRHVGAEMLSYAC